MLLHMCRPNFSNKHHFPVQYMIRLRCENVGIDSVGCHHKDCAHYRHSTSGTAPAMHQHYQLGLRTNGCETDHQIHVFGCMLVVACVELTKTSTEKANTKSIYL